MNPLIPKNVWPRSRATLSPWKRPSWSSKRTSKLASVECEPPLLRSNTTNSCPKWSETYTSSGVSQGPSSMRRLGTSSSCLNLHQRATRSVTISLNYIHRNSRSHKFHLLEAALPTPNHKKYWISRIEYTSKKWWLMLRTKPQQMVKSKTGYSNRRWIHLPGLLDLTALFLTICVNRWSVHSAAPRYHKTKSIREKLT